MYCNVKAGSVLGFVKARDCVESFYIMPLFIESGIMSNLMSYPFGA